MNAVIQSQAEAERRSRSSRGKTPVPSVLTSYARCHRGHHKSGDPPNQFVHMRALRRVKVRRPSCCRRRIPGLEELVFPERPANGGYLCCSGGLPSVRGCRDLTTRYAVRRSTMRCLSSNSQR